ncbi:cysteine peptidase family C39 domain-containing protein [Ursidibacter sp. B-7004-1]
MLDKLNFSFFKKVPVVLQTESAECGLACLAMVAGYYSGESNLFRLRSKYGISSKGATLRNLVDIASDLKLITRPLSLELDELKLLRLPCILHWDFNHFVVLTKATDRYVVIHDPAFGKKKISLTECSKHFTGVALEVWSDVRFKSPKIVKKSASMKPLRISLGLKGH